MDASGKSPRDVDYPRITFHTPERTFDRLFKESSLSDLQETVRRKLRINSGDVVHLTQLRNGDVVDLEDEDDFDAFYAVAYSQRLVNVEVTLSNKPASAEPPPALDEQPQQSHKRKHDVQGVSEQEAEAHVEGPSKKRKVAFTQPSIESHERESASQEAQRKKRKDVDDSTVSEAPKKKKMSVDSSATPKKTRGTLKAGGSGTKAAEKKSSAQSQVLASTNQDIPSSASKRSRPVLKDQAMTPGANVRESEGAPRSGEQPSTSGKAIEAPASTKDQASKKPSSKQKADSTGKDQKAKAFPQKLAGAIHDAHSSNRKELEGTQNDDSMVGRTKDKVDSSITQEGAKGDAKKRKKKTTTDTGKATSALEVNNEETRDMEVIPEGPTTDPSPANTKTTVQLKNIMAKLLEKKRKAASSSPLDEAQGKQLDSSVPGSSEATTNDKSKPSGSLTKKGARSSMASAEPASLCLVCGKAPRHGLAECLIVQEGPASIQRRIKALRATKKFSDDEKLPVISELQKIKADQRKAGKGKNPETNVNIQSSSLPAPSRPRRSGHKSVADHTNGVVGASKDKEPHSLNQGTSDGRDPSTSSGGQSSSDPTPLQQVIGNLAGNDSSLDVPHVDDVSRLANLDLDALVKGPENSFLSINDIPSSDDGNDSDNEKMSGEPEEEEEKERHPMKLTRKLSSADEDNESQDDNDEYGFGNPGTTVEPLGRDQFPILDGSSNSQPNGPGNDIHDSVKATAGGGVRETDGHTSNMQVDVSPPIHEETADAGNQADEIEPPSPHRPLSLELRSPIMETTDKEEDRVLRSKTKKKSSPTEDASNRPKRTRSTAKTPKKAERVSLTQVSETIQDSARNSETALLEAPTPARLRRPPTLLTGLKAKRPRSPNVKKTAAKKKNGPASASESLDPSPAPVSRNGWAALKDGSPQLDEDGDPMVDELLSSSPKSFKENNSTSSREYPLSQNQAHATDSDSQDEAEVDSSLKSSRIPRYRSLSKIKGTPGRRFSLLLSRPLRRPLAPLEDLYGPKGKSDTESDESSLESESELEKLSHIPKQRRAGRM